MSHRSKKITVIHLRRLLLTHNAKLDKFINWKEVRKSVEPQEALKSFRSSDICLLVKNLYPQDFTDYDKCVGEGVLSFWAKFWRRNFYPPYGCVFEKKFSLISARPPPPPPRLKSWVRSWLTLKHVKDVVVLGVWYCRNINFAPSC